MSNTFVPGHLCPVGVSFAVGVTPVTLGVKEHATDFEIAPYDVTHTGTLGHRARLAGLVDARGNVTADLDADAAPWNLNIVPGVNCLVDAVYNGDVTHPWAIPALIVKVHFAQRVDAQITWNFDWVLNVLAFRGFVSLPVDPALNLR